MWIDEPGCNDQVRGVDLLGLRRNVRIGGGADFGDGTVLNNQASRRKFV